MQEYEGYFENGQFYPIGQTSQIKGRRRAIINILDDETAETQTCSEKQYEALQKFSKAIKEINDEPLDDEFFAIITSGIQIDNGVDL